MLYEVALAKLERNIEAERDAESGIIVGSVVCDQCDDGNEL